MNTLVIIAICSAVGFAVYWFVFRKKVSHAINNSQYLAAVDVWFDETTRTAVGIEVLSNGVSQDVLDAIDRGWTAARTDAVASGYTEKLDPTQYRAYVHPTCQPSPEQQIPSFLIRADNYDGTDFDQYNPKGKGVKDGKGMVFAAELVTDFGLGSPYPAQAAIVVCPGVAENAARYGFEHILAFHNDDDYYSRTATHADGQGHPLLPQPPPYNPTKIVGGVFVPR